jgi:hypothetical protein
VVQDVRGRFPQMATFIPSGMNQTMAMTLLPGPRQPWSTGKVGMFGLSYVGATQWGAYHHPAGPCHYRTSSHCLRLLRGWTYQGGAFELVLMPVGP